MKSDLFTSAEDFFGEAWESENLDRDFGDDPESMRIYGEEKPHDVEHFILPESKDSQGTPYTYHSIPLDLFAERVREQLEDTNESPAKRLENAINYAENLGLDGNAEILKRTKNKLESDSVI